MELGSLVNRTRGRLDTETQVASRPAQGDARACEATNRGEAELPAWVHSLRPPLSLSDSQNLSLV